MKITELFESIRIVLSNEERKFIDTHGDQVFLTSLDDRATWLAQNLVRKGIYEISNDTKQLVKVNNAFYLRSSI
jgi:hypothetical protein